MKCIKKQGKHVMEYLRVSDEEAERKVNHQEWKYTSKEEFKSNKSEFVKNEGTLVNTTKEGAQKLVNYKGIKLPKGTSSTKIGKGSLNNPNIVRTDKFDKPSLTLKETMKLSLKFFIKDNETFKDVQTQIKVCKARKAKLIATFDREINPQKDEEKN